MSAIRNYSLVVEYSAGDLVKTVTDACAKGFQPIGGVSLTREPAEPKKGTVTGRLVFAQAMIRLYTANDAMTQIVTSAPKINGS